MVDASVARPGLGTFGALCDVLNQISRSDSGYTPDDRVNVLSNLFRDIANASGGALQEAPPAARLAATLRLLVPWMDATPRRLDVNAITVRNLFSRVLAEERTLLPAPAQGWPSAAYSATTRAQLAAWPVGAAQASVNRFIERGGDKRGVRIADVSDYVAATCPYGVPGGEEVPTAKIRDAVNVHGLLSVIDVDRLVMSLKTAHPAELQLRVLRSFVTAEQRQPTADDVPWNAEWRWFARILLRRMYANVREKRTLDALHPMAWGFSDLQHDVDRIASAFTEDVQFPYETALGCPCRVMRCNAMSFIPLAASTLNPRFISQHGTTAGMAAHIVGNDGGEAAFLLGHSWMTTWRSVKSVVLETAGDPKMKWLGQSASESAGDSAAKTLTTEAEHMVKIRFHAAVLDAVFPTPAALAAVLNTGEGFSYAIMLYNTVHKTYEYILHHRMWTLLQRKLAVPPGTEIHVLPRGLFKRLIKNGRAADMLPPSLDRLRKVVQLANARELPPGIALAQRALGDAPVFDATPEVKGFLVEEKYDGDRMQLHLRILEDGTTPIRAFFTRGGYNRAGWYDGVIRRVMLAVAGKGVEQFIIDGEMVVYDTARGTYSPWGLNRKIAQQEGAGAPLDTRKRGGLVVLHEGISDLAEEEPVTAMDDPRFAESETAVDGRDADSYTVIPGAQLCFIAFDILHLNGQDLVSLPLFRRREILESLFPPRDDAEWRGLVEVSHARYAHTSGDVATELEAVVKRQGEGLVLKDPFTPYRGGQSAYWQKVKAHSDTVDMAIVGFGFQVASDLASTGDPHISSFTVAVRDAKNPKRLLTVCEVPFFAVPLEASDKAKEEYLQEPTAVRVDEIAAALRSGVKDSDGFVRVDLRNTSSCTLYAKTVSTSQQVVLKWVSNANLAMSPDDDIDPLVYYDKSFTNIQVVAHPFLVGYSIAVYGDYRVNTGYDRRRSRFTAPLTIRFPRGVLRRARTKPPSECDSTAKLEDLKQHAETDPMAVIAADMRRVHRVMPTGLRDDASADDLVSIDATTSVSKRVLSTQTLKFANETDLANASNADLVAAMKAVNQRWPTAAASAKQYADANKSPPTSPLPSPRPPPSRSPRSPRSPLSPASPLQFITVPMLASPRGVSSSSPRSVPMRAIPQPPPLSRYAAIQRRLDTALALAEQMLAQAEKAALFGRG